MTRLKWLPGDRLTVVHSARNYLMGLPSVDPTIHEVLADSVGDLYDRLLAAEIDMAVFWKRLLGAVAAGDDDQAACTRALLASGCSPLASDQVASAIVSRLTDIRLGYQQRQPKLVEQLTLRGRPLREQWDGYGGGLTKRISKLTHESFVPKSATVWLLAPYCGGDGDLDADSGRLWMEAVLTNPVPQLPEVLRLTWLVAKLGLMQALASAKDDSQGDPWVAPLRLPRVAELATIAFTLEAAAYLELAPVQDHNWAEWFDLAAKVWRVPLDDHSRDTMLHWWKQYLDLRTSPAVAFKALDRMLL